MIVKNVCLMLISMFFLLSSYGQGIESKIFNVIDFGAKPNSSVDSRKAFQKCLDEASRNRGKCFVPEGVYVLSGDIFLNSNTIFQGVSEKTVLKFKQGGIRGKKNNSTNFFYPQNYGKEIVPSAVETSIVRVDNKSRNSIVVKDPSKFKKGDDIVVFNGKRNTWTILENENKSGHWNTEDLNTIGRGGSFVIEDIKNNILVLNEGINFDNWEDQAKVSLRSGIKDVVIKDLTIEAAETFYGINIEQPLRVKISGNVISGRGGVLLSNYANDCEINDNNIVAGPNFCISVENFSSHNIIKNNDVVFKRNSYKGKDCAIIVVLSSYNNVVAYNKVQNIGEVDRNFGGIFVHAFCFNNKVYGNNITGASTGLGVYFGSYNNIFQNNSVVNSRIGFVSHYTRLNTISNNTFGIKFKTKMNTYGFLSLGSKNIIFSQNRIKGDMTFGVAVQDKILSDSTFGEIQNNDIVREGNGYSLDVNVIGSNKKVFQTRIENVRSQNRFKW